MNLMAVAVKPINDALKKPVVKVKYTYQVNFIEAITTTKSSVVSFFLTRKFSDGLKRLHDRISRITQPVRPGRKFERNQKAKRKYYMNYKPT